MKAAYPSHVLVRHINQDPKDRRMWQIGHLEGSWVRRKVHTRIDEDGEESHWIEIGGLEYELGEIQWMEAR